MKSEKIGETPAMLRAIAHQPLDHPPVWIMRQAGRYLPEYRQLREKASFLDLCHKPELAVAASLMPIKRFDLDAAIIFSDILVPVTAMGAPVAFGERGPQLETPIRSAAQVEALRVAHPKETMNFVLEAITALKQELKGRLPVIGFAGAPFTLAAYCVEGRTSSTFGTLREMLYRDPDLYHRLAGKLAATVGQHLLAQVEAGASVVQLFDTWAGLLSEEEYVRFALPYERLALQPVIDAGHPTILYINGSPHFFHRMIDSGAQVVSLDWRTPIHRARCHFGDRLAVQGNLNPIVLFTADHAMLREEVRNIVSAYRDNNGKSRGHIFNLGHGIHPTTPIDNVQRMIDAVKSNKD